MQTIYRYQLIVAGEQVIEMPKLSTILSVQTQNDVPFIWAKVDTDLPIVKTTIRIIGTGYKAEDLNYLSFIGTIQIGNLVFHVFQDPRLK